MAETALTLSTTEFDRPTVVIDGASYEMRSEQEMSVAFIRRLQALAEELKRDDAELEERADALKDAVRLVMVELPDDVLESLTIRQHSKIVETFSELARPKSADGGPASDGATRS